MGKPVSKVQKNTIKPKPMPSMDVSSANLNDSNLQSFLGSNHESQEEIKLSDKLPFEIDNKKLQSKNEILKILECFKQHPVFNCLDSKQL